LSKVFPHSFRRKKGKIHFLLEGLLAAESAAREGQRVEKASVGRLVIEKDGGDEKGQEKSGAEPRHQGQVGA
jgi:hypothetical protein